MFVISPLITGRVSRVENSFSILFWEAAGFDFEAPGASGKAGAGGTWGWDEKMLRMYSKTGLSPLSFLKKSGRKLTLVAFGLSSNCSPEPTAASFLNPNISSNSSTVIKSFGLS